MRKVAFTAGKVMILHGAASAQLPHSSHQQEHEMKQKKTFSEHLRFVKTRRKFYEIDAESVGTHSGHIVETRSKV